MIAATIQSREMGLPDKGQPLSLFYRGGNGGLSVWPRVWCRMGGFLTAQLELNGRPSLPLVNTRGTG